MGIQKLTLSLIACLCALALQARDVPEIRKGVLDLRQSETPFKQIALSGEWEFYWNEFIPAGKADLFREKRSMYAPVPAYWTQYKDSIPGITGEGFGTYRLLVLLPDQTRDSLALSVPVFDAAFRLYLNGELAGGNGIPGRNRELTEPAYDPFLKTLDVNSGTLEIVIHVSNFHHRRGGFWKTMVLGQERTMQQKLERTKLIDHALVGILFGAFVLFLVFYLIQRQNKASLYFSLTTLGILLRLLHIGIYPIYAIAELPWIWVVRMEYIGTFTGFMFGMLFLAAIFPRSLPRWITRLNTAIFAIISLLTLFLGVRVFSYFMFVLQVCMLLMLSYYAVFSFMGMLKRKTSETLFFIALVSLLAAAINDSLIAFSREGISNENLIPLAYFLIVAANVIIIINQWMQSYREKHLMHEEILHVNRNLESIIENRTRELNQKNEELEASISMKNRMFSIIAHDLKGPISTLAQYTEVLLQKSETSGSNDLAANLKQMAYSLIDLVDNLVFWGMSQRREISFRAETCDLGKQVDHALKLFSGQVEHKQIRLETRIPEKTEAWCDPVLVSIILRNLVSNAIKFTPEGGTVTVAAKKDGEGVLFSIVDTGLGMNPEKIEELMHAEQLKGSEGTKQESGTGLGFIVTRDLVALHGGKLVIKSEPGKGTEVQFTLPGNHEK